MKSLFGTALISLLTLISAGSVFGQCPTVTIDAPATVGIGEATPFTLKVAGAPAGVKPRVIWISTAGEIVERSDDDLTAWVGTRDMNIGARFVVTASITFPGCEPIYFHPKPVVGPARSKAPCPTVSIKRESYTLPGLAMILKAVVEGAVPGREPVYTWKFSPSFELVGAGGRETEVIPDGVLPPGSTVEAMVDVLGFAGCKASGKASFTVPGTAPAPAAAASKAPEIEANKIDNFNPLELKWSRQKERMDTDASDLAEDPTAQLQLVYYTEPGKPKKDVLAAATRAMQYLKERLRTEHKSNPDRITIVDGGASSYKAFLEFWLVPKGAKPFKPEQE